jgi:hypothetical protein
MFSVSIDRSGTTSKRNRDTAPTAENSRSCYNAAMIVPVTVTCPYCGESFETQADGSAGDQEYTEDCFVCCRPIVFTLAVDLDGNPLAIETRREDD